MRIKSPEIMRIIVTAEYISLCEVTPMDKIQISSDFSYVYLYLYVQVLKSKLQLFEDCIEALKFCQPSSCRLSSLPAFSSSILNY